MRQAIIIVKATDRAGANAVTKLIDRAGGERTFTVGLHPSGNPNPPPSHYWCAWWVTDAEWDALAAEFADGNGRRQSRMFDGEQWAPDAVLVEMGLMRQAVRDG